MPGPQPKPTIIKHAEGNPGKRRLNWGEITEAPKIPDPPDWLDGIARRKFRELGKILLRRRLIRQEDQMQLANLCQAYSILRTAQKRLARTPANRRLLVKQGNGISANPLLWIIRDQVEVINKIAQQFGLSATARAKLPLRDDLPPDVSPGAAADALEAVLSGDAETDPGDHEIVIN